MLTSGLIIFTSPSHSLHKKECEGGGGGGAEPGGLRQPRARHPWVGTGGPGTCLRRCLVEREHPRQKPRHLFGNHGTWTLSQLLLFPHVRYSLTARQAMTEARCSTPPGTTAAPARQGADDIGNSIDVNRFYFIFWQKIMEFPPWNSKIMQFSTQHCVWDLYPSHIPPFCCVFPHRVQISPKITPNGEVDASERTTCCGGGRE